MASPNHSTDHAERDSVLNMVSLDELARGAGVVDDDAATLVSFSGNNTATQEPVRRNSSSSCSTSSSLSFCWKENSTRNATHKPQDLSGFFPARPSRAFLAEPTSLETGTPGGFTPQQYLPSHWVMHVDRPLSALPAAAEGALMNRDSPPPAYEPAGPPPVYLRPAAAQSAAHQLAARDREDDDTSFDVMFGFESSERRTIRMCGLRWWMIAAIGSDVVFSTFLLLITLAMLSQKSVQPMNAANVVLPFVYVIVSAYGKASVSRDRAIGKTIYAITFMARWLADIGGVVAVMRHATTEKTPFDDADDYREIEVSFMTWVMEAARALVTGMRPSQDSACILGDTPCTWRLGVWGGMLVIHFTLAMVVITRVIAEFKNGREKAISANTGSTNDDNNDFRSSVAISAPSGPSMIRHVSIAMPPASAQFADITHIIRGSTVIEPQTTAQAEGHGGLTTRARQSETWIPRPPPMVHFGDGIFRPRPASWEVPADHPHYNQQPMSAVARPEDDEDDERPLVLFMR
ncbi:hypothetical protein DFJ77DRAFT_449766 [Powellomyces hirtus]|nr:hypothetical protein DFJ77DRAFT_449766 [Powellomyces hirtus]